MGMINYNANSLSERKGDLRSRKIARFGLVISLFIVLNTAFLKIDSVYANTTNHYRQWAFIQLNDLDEFYCLDELYFRESRWNPKARNGSHYGIPQGKSKWLKTATPYQQIDWQLKYIKKRYSNPCNALAHHKIKGWY